MLLHSNPTTEMLPQISLSFVYLICSGLVLVTYGQNKLILHYPVTPPAPIFLMYLLPVHSSATVNFTVLNTTAPKPGTPTSPVPYITAPPYVTVPPESGTPNSPVPYVTAPPESGTPNSSNNAVTNTTAPQPVTPNSNSLPPAHESNPPIFPPSLPPAHEPSVVTNTAARHPVDTNKGFSVGIIVGACAIVIGIVSIWLALRWKKKLYKNDHIFDVSFGDEFEDGIGPKKFSYCELASATNNFREEQKLGEGGFGAVYKGFLKNLNTLVAVKKISKFSKQGSKEYTTEVKIISRLRHRNTVRLIGWCHERELILVYEFMPNGSLDSHLFKGKSLLTWMVRYKIAQDVALALLYLHEEGDHCVLHRDIKSSNIMLDSNFNAKLGDFGLARLVDHAKGSQTTGWAGTMGYMAPECLTAVSKASKQSDVFSFGVVAMEIACGRRSIEHQREEDQVSLVPWVWELYGTKRLLDAVDKRLAMNFDMEQMECLIIVGLWCAHPNRNLRLSIRQVIQILNFELPLPNLPPRMPIPNYDMPTVQSVCSGNQPSQSLTILR